MDTLTGGDDVVLDALSGKMSYGSLRKVVYYLVYKDTNAINCTAFVQCLSHFDVTPRELLTACMDVYRRVPEGDRSAMANFVCNAFYGRYAQEWSADSACWSQVLEVAAARQDELLNFKAKGVAPRVDDPLRSHEVLDTSTKKKRCFQWFSWKEEELAVALTAIGHADFVKMGLGELLGPPRPFLEPQIVRFRQLSDLVTFSVVNASAPADAIKRSIKVAQQLLNLNNFNDFAAVLAGLNSMVVQSMKKAWEDVSRKHRDQFDAFEKLLSPVRNFGEYRKALQDVPKDQPCYPYLALLMKDLLYINDGNPSLLPVATKDGATHTLLNLDKISFLGAFFDKCRTFQSSPYTKLKPDPAVELWIHQWPSFVPDLSTLSESEMEHSEKVAERKESFFRKMFGKLKSESSTPSFPEPGRVPSLVLTKAEPASSKPSPARPGSTTPNAVNSPGVSPVNSSRTDTQSAASTAVSNSQTTSEHEEDIAVIGPDMEDQADIQLARELAEFLTMHGLSKYLQYFEMHEIPKSRLKELTDADLSEMGISKAVHRAKILEGIRFSRTIATPRRLSDSAMAMEFSNALADAPASPVTQHETPHKVRRSRQSRASHKLSSLALVGSEESSGSAPPSPARDGEAAVATDMLKSPARRTEGDSSEPKVRRSSKARAALDAESGETGEGKPSRNVRRERSHSHHVRQAATDESAPEPTGDAAPASASPAAAPAGTPSEGKPRRKKNSVARRQLVDELPVAPSTAIASEGDAGETTHAPARRKASGRRHRVSRRSVSVDVGSDASKGGADQQQQRPEEPSQNLPIKEEVVACCKCEQPLGGETPRFFDQAGLPYCADCHAETLGRVCVRCKRGVASALRAMDRFWHDECFTCEKCQEPITGAFMELGGMPYHLECASPPVAPPEAAPAPAAAAPPQVTVIGTYQGNAVTLTVPLKTPFEELRKAFGEAFQRPDLVLKMLDFEGDWITLKKQTDFDYAVESTTVMGKTTLNLMVV